MFAQAPFMSARALSQREAALPDIELFVDAHARIGESLLWDAERGWLYWVDIKQPALYRVDPGTLAMRRWDLPADAGAFALLEGQEAVLVALRTGLYALSLETGALQPIAPPPYDPALFRFNEGACDPVGRFWVGVMFDPMPGHEDAKPEKGPLSSWTSATGLVDQAERAELHNGMGWSPDGQTFYLSHSFQHAVFAYPYNVATGALGPRREIAHLPGGQPLPDGAAVDEEGAYWCAIHGGWKLQRYAPDGTLLLEVKLPVSQPTMCAFGGPDLRTMFISSAAQKLGPQALAGEPHAGGLFRFDPGVRGAPKPYIAR